MPKFLICPYKMGSAGARNLREELSSRLGYEVARVDSNFALSSNQWVINWGNGNFLGYKEPGAVDARVFNPRTAVNKSICKISFFMCMNEAGLPIPFWTTKQALAQKWENDGDRVYCRLDVEGRDGRGIEISEKQDYLPSAPLYTKGVDSTCEYRIHVFQGDPIFDLIKNHKNPTAAQRLVRSGGNGWYYSRECVAPKSVKKLASDCCDALELDFCAVDILWNNKTEKATLLESNTAPELGPWTRAAYAKKFLARL